MKFRNAAPAVAGIFLVLAGCSETPPDTREADTKALKDLETQWNTEYKAKELDKMTAHYTADAVLMTPGAPAASSADARRAMIKEILDDPAGSLSFQTASVEVARSGDLAATRGPYTLTMTNPATKKPFTDHGSFVTVYKKQADGSWKAFSDINVSEVPLPAPPVTARKAPARKKKK